MAGPNSTLLSDEAGLSYRRLFVAMTGCVACLAELYERRNQPDKSVAPIIDSFEVFADRVEAILDDLGVPRGWH